jgi:hypothetical protein
VNNSQLTLHNGHNLNQTLQIVTPIKL